MQAFPPDTATRAIVEAAAASVGADLSTPENASAAADLVAYLQSERQGGDAFEMEPEPDIDDMPGRPGILTVRNTRTRTGAAVWCHRGRFDWEF